MTYGWALILIATIIGVLVFMIDPATSTYKCKTFDSMIPTFICKGATRENGRLFVTLQNITGYSITLDPYEDIAFDGTAHLAVINYGNETYRFGDVTIPKGATFTIEGSGAALTDTVSVTYTDTTGSEHTARISINKGSNPPVIEISNDGIDDDGDGFVDCDPSDPDGSTDCEYPVNVIAPLATAPEDLMLNINTESNGMAEIAQPKTDLGNLEYIGVKVDNKTIKAASLMTGMALMTSTRNLSVPIIEEKDSWRDMVDPYLLQDPEAVAAFEDANMASPYLVDSLAGADYYLVPFTKDGLATGVIMLDAQDGHFMQAAWTSAPQKYLPVDEKEALYLAKKAAMEELGPKNVKIGLAETRLEWKPGPYSQSPFMPYWAITINKQDWIVAQEGEAFKGS